MIGAFSTRHLSKGISQSIERTSMTDGHFSCWTGKSEHFLFWKNVSSTSQFVWSSVFATLKATPAYLQDLFYRNVPESESAFDRTTPSVKKEVIAMAPKKDVEATELAEAPAVQELSSWEAL